MKRLTLQVFTGFTIAGAKLAKVGGGFGLEGIADAVLTRHEPLPERDGSVRHAKTFRKRPGTCLVFHNQTW